MAFKASALVIVLSILTLLDCQDIVWPPSWSFGTDALPTSTPAPTSASIPTLKRTPTPAQPPTATPIPQPTSTPAPTTASGPTLKPTLTPTPPPPTTTPVSQPTPMPVDTPTKRPPTKGPLPALTPQPQHGTPGVDCEPKCSWDFVPAVTSVEWVEPPTVSESGKLSLKVKVGENDRMTFPNEPGGGASNIALTNGGTRLYGMIIPPAPPGMTWNPAPGQWVADTYHLHALIFTVSARIDVRTASYKDLTLCLWTGGLGAANRVLTCTPVTGP